MTDWSLFQSALLVLFCASLAVQLLYWWVVFAPFTYKKGDKKPHVPVLPPCTVVICARNEAKNLPLNLPLILTQKYPGFEVLVVDDASTDATAEILAGLQKSYDHLKVHTIFEKISGGKKNALTAGIRQAKHEMLVLTDADCRPASADWLRRMVESVAGTDNVLALGYGPNSSQNGFLNRWARFETFFTALQYSAWASAGFPYMGVGRNLTIRKSAFEKSGGFQEHSALVSGDDDLLVNALATKNNTARCLHPDAWMYSEAPPDLKAWIRQKRRHLSTGTRYRPVHRLLLGGFEITQCLFYAALVGGLALGTIPQLYLAGYLLRIGSVWGIGSLTGRKLGIGDLIKFWPVFDFLLALYWGAVAPVLLFLPKAKIEWKQKLP